MTEKYVKASRAVARMVAVSNQIYRAISALVRDHDLTESQYNALRILRGADKRGESLTQAELADRLIASRANTTWILDKLEDRRLVKRRGHRDRRKNLLEITTAGKRLLAKIDPQFEELLGRMINDISEKDLNDLLRISDKFRFD
jgi:DNA-binding MarR family transcriptional regulator